MTSISDLQFTDAERYAFLLSILTDGRIEGELLADLDAQMRDAARQGTLRVERYSHTSKGGAYALVGEIAGAGSNRGLGAIAYQDTITGKLYFRATADFADYIVELPIDDE